MLRFKVIVMNELECVVDAKSILGEGVFWNENEQCIYWLDIDGCIVHRFDPVTRKNTSRKVGKKVGTVVPTDSGKLTLGLSDGVYGFDFETGELDKRCDPMEGNTENRFNDGKAGPDGRFYIGSMGESPSEALYRIENDGRWAEIENGITCSNGLVWSLDNRTFYYIDSPTRSIVAYDFDMERGDLSNRRVIVEVDPKLGIPDGMTIDSEGMLWVAHWQGWGVRRWNPNTGKVLQEISVPVERVTSCAFGGADYRDLYITTASVEMADEDWVEQPQAGGLFRIRLDVAGVPCFTYRG